MTTLTARVGEAAARGSALWVSGWSLLCLWPLLSWAEAPQISAPCTGPRPRGAPLDQDYRQHQGKTIAAIRFETRDVFDTNDPDENNRLYRLMNYLHVDTRPKVIAAQLLFESGEPLNARALAESERLLRTRSYLGDAFIRVDEDCGDYVALRVVTRDIWTLDPQTSISREGGESKFGFGFSEDNLLGSGNALSIGYNKNQERSSRAISLYSPHLFNSRLEARLGFADTSDGQQTMARIERPFFSVHTPWAAGVSNSDTSIQEVIRYGGEEINRFRHASEYHEGFLGWAFERSEERAQRLILGFTQDRQIFTAMETTVDDVPDNRNLVYPWLEYRYLENQYAVYRNLNLLHQTEDVAIGADLRVRIGHGGAYLGNDRDFLIIQLEYADMLALSEHRLLHIVGELRSLDYSGEGSKGELLWGGELGFHQLDGPKRRWYAELQYHQGNHLPLHEQLTIGGSEGLRGYPVGYQRGDRRYLLRLEKRYITDVHLFNVLRLGAVAYLDTGRAWGAGYGRASHLSNLGMGLRFSSSKAKVGRLLHVDIAVPLVDRERVDSFQWVFTASSSL